MKRENPPRFSRFSGDLTDISDADVAAGETVPELISEGQGLEAEEIQAVEDAPDPDRASVKVRPFPPNKSHSYNDRNRL